MEKENSAGTDYNNVASWAMDSTVVIRVFEYLLMKVQACADEDLIHLQTLLDGISQKQVHALIVYRLYIILDDTRTVYKNLQLLKAKLTGSFIVKLILDILHIYILGRVRYFSFKYLEMNTEFCKLLDAVKYEFQSLKSKRSFCLENKIDLKMSLLLLKHSLIVQDFQKNAHAYRDIPGLQLNHANYADPIFFTYGENRINISTEDLLFSKCKHTTVVIRPDVQQVTHVDVGTCNAKGQKIIISSEFLFDVKCKRNTVAQDEFMEKFILPYCLNAKNIERSSLKKKSSNCMKVYETYNDSCFRHSCLTGGQFVTVELGSNFEQSITIQISNMPLNTSHGYNCFKLLLLYVPFAFLLEEYNALDTYLNRFVCIKYSAKHTHTFPFYPGLNDLSHTDCNRLRMSLLFSTVIAGICLSIVHQRHAVKSNHNINDYVPFLTITFVLLSMSDICTKFIQIPRRKQLYEHISSGLKTYLKTQDNKLKKSDIIKIIIGHHKYRRNDSYVVCPVTNPQQTNTCMSNELLRLGSLYNYPTDNCPSLIRLASSGFFYEGRGREVRCFSCDILHEDWSYSSDPFEIHRRISPNCGYLNQHFPVATTSTLHYLSQNQLQIGKPQVAEQEVVTTYSNPDSGVASDQFVMLASSSHQPVFAKSSLDSGYASNGASTFCSSRSNLSASRNRSLVTSRDSGYGSKSSLDHTSSVQNGDIQADNINRKTQLPVINEACRESIRENETPIYVTVTEPRPKYPEYEPVERRRATYKNWPENVHFLHPLDLSECGFFYSNFGDCVRCFQCGIGLRNWESDDNPWVEHARWSRKCYYLLQKKGQGFIDSVLTVLGLQTDAEIEQSRGTPSEPLIPQSAENSIGPQSQFHVDGDPLTHEAAKYVIREKIFGSNLELVKRGIIQLLQEHDWRSITRDMLVLHILEHQNGIEYMETNDQNRRAEAKELSEKKLTELCLSNYSNSVSEEKESSKGYSNGENAEQIQKENEELKDLYTCKICLDEKVGITFVPCGHLVTCKNCSPKIRRCPLCRTFIRGTIKTTI